jgi:GTP:adenosylcobinamide-phosphate guanylyltransferase
MIGLIPASGKATRFNGLPKFSLPCDLEGTSLIKRQVSQMLPNVDKVVICTSSKWKDLIDSFEIDAELIVVEPSTMNDAIFKMMDYKKSDSYIVGMADIYFKGENPYEKLSKYTNEYLLSVACWKINNILKGKVGQVQLLNNRMLDLQDKQINCQYPHMWGAFGFKKEIMYDMYRKDQHFGTFLIKEAYDNFNNHYAFEIDGEYFDVGSMINYKNLLNSLEI